jgi:hypothetical protein
LRPSRIELHTAEPRATTGSTSAATTAASSSSIDIDNTGDNNSPSCQAANRIAPTASPASNSTSFAADASSACAHALPPPHHAADTATKTAITKMNWTPRALCTSSPFRLMQANLHHKEGRSPRHYILT